MIIISPDGIQWATVGKDLSNERVLNTCKNPTGVQVMRESHLQSWVCLAINMCQAYRLDSWYLLQLLSVSFPY